MKFLEQVNWISVLGVLVAVEMQIGNGSMSIAHMFPAAWVPGIKEGMGDLGSIGALIMSAGALGRVPGAQIPTIPPAVKSAIILAVAFGGLLAFSGDVRAQGIKLKPLTGDVAKDFAPAGNANAGAPALTGNIEKDATAIWKKLAALTKADITYAIAKAKNAGTNASSIRLQCLQAISDANDQANGAGLKNPDGTDMVRPDPALVTSIEDVAELVDNLSPQGKLFTSCAGAAQMFKTNTLAVINAIVTGAAGIAALPAGL